MLGVLSLYSGNIYRIWFDMPNLIKWFCAFYYDHFYFIYIIYRSECKENILASLSEESKIKRRRRNTIGIQITAISWILEFFGGIIALARFWMRDRTETSPWPPEPWASSICRHLCLGMSWRHCLILWWCDIASSRSWLKPRWSWFLVALHCLSRSQ